MTSVFSRNFCKMVRYIDFVHAYKLAIRTYHLLPEFMWGRVSFQIRRLGNYHISRGENITWFHAIKKRLAWAAWPRFLERAVVQFRPNGEVIIHKIFFEKKYWSRQKMPTPTRCDEWDGVRIVPQPCGCGRSKPKEGFSRWRKIESDSDVWDKHWRGRKFHNLSTFPHSACDVVVTSDHQRALEDMNGLYWCYLYCCAIPNIAQ